jgi:NADH-quinone oxidoreductase subunit L
MILLSLLIALAPLLNFLILSIFPSKLKNIADKWAITFQSIAFICSAYLFFSLINNHLIVAESWNWLSFLQATLKIGIHLDFQSVAMILTVNLISLLVHIFSVSYMHEDEGYVRYFSYLGLFTFAMLGLVLADSVWLMYVFWELVGLASYLLIGFWREKISANQAAKKAFLLNRIGDAGFLASILALFLLFGTTHIQELTQKLAISPIQDEFLWQIIGVGVLMGAIGKSAQFPLSVWLPDAMEGPTPVSALIHAATMVAAGVYLVARLSFLFSPEVNLLMTSIGTLTAFLAGFAALSQVDIKKILAYSTISQLGYMMLGAGVGATSSAMFHLLTHAFFKAGLFLGAGAIIYSMHELSHKAHKDFDAQDIRNMGGLKNTMPFTFWTFLICAFSLAGIPLFSGFLSKEAILLKSVEFASNYHTNNSLPLVWLIPFLAFTTALFTSFYIGRLIFRVFWGEFKLKNSLQIQETPREVSKWMYVPLIVLATLSLAPIYSLNPLDAQGGWLANLLQVFLGEGSHTSIALLSISLSLLGLLIAYLLYVKGIGLGLKNRLFAPNSFLYKLSFKHWYLNDLYELLVKIILKIATYFQQFEQNILDQIIKQFAIFQVVVAQVIAWIDKYLVDGVIDSLVFLVGRMGFTTKSMQDGKIQHYFALTILSLLGIILWLMY